MRILVSVPAESDLGPLPGPVQFLATDAFIVKLEGLHEVLTAHALASVATSDAVEVWGDPSFAAHNRLHDDEMVMSANGFRFTATSPVLGRVTTALLDVRRFAATCREYSESELLQLDAFGDPLRAHVGHAGAPAAYARA